MGNPSRIRIEQQFRVHQFADEILVKCPKYGGCARARDPKRDEKERTIQMRVPMSCLHCAKQHEFVIEGWDYWAELPLWLTTTCYGHVLWALNSRHMMALQDFVAAGLRENKLGHPTNRHMYMSLPRWITSKKNRSDVLRGLKRLQSKLTRAT